MQHQHIYFQAMGENGETLGGGRRQKKGIASAREGDGCAHGHGGGGLVDGDKILPSVTGSVKGGCGSSQGDKGKGTASTREIPTG